MRKFGWLRLGGLLGMTALAGCTTTNAAGGTTIATFVADFLRQIAAALLT